MNPWLHPLRPRTHIRAVRWAGVSDHRCPDCDVEMETTTATAEGVGEIYVETEREDGILKRLGVGSRTPLTALLCPECGLTRFYADIPE